MININKLWENVLQKISSKILAISYEVWIEVLEPVCIYNNKLVLCAPSKTAKSCVVKNYSKTINVAISEVNSTITDNIIIEASEKEDYLNKQEVFLCDQIVIQEDIEKEDTFANFTKKFSFDTFIIGKSNEFACAAAKAVSESPGSAYNPLFIYGGVGLGKTHIIHSIGNYIKKNSPHLKVMYITSETFTNEFVDSIRNSAKSPSSTQNFREKYRKVDVLMIDDIQFFAGKSGVQESIFHTFNDLYQNGKQIIFTSDRLPKEIKPLEERLRTRFEWGLIADIQSPDLETRIAILKKKAEQNNAVICNEVIEFIAKKVETNIREMEGLLNKIIFYSSLVGKSATIPIAMEALKDFIDIKEDSAITPQDIIDYTCNYFSISLESIIGKKKTKDIVVPRQIAIYLITDLLSVPLASIGEIFGGRDHTTIIHARDKISNEIKINTKIKVAVSDLKNMIYHR